MAKEQIFINNNPIMVVHPFFFIRDNVILFRRNDASLSWGSISGTVENYDIDILDTIIRETKEETRVSLSAESIKRSSYSAVCLSPNTQKKLKINTFYYRLTPKLLNQSDIILNPDELNGYEVLYKYDALTLMDISGERESFNGLKRLVEEGLI